MWRDASIQQVLSRHYTQAWPFFVRTSSRIRPMTNKHNLRKPNKQLLTWTHPAKRHYSCGNYSSRALYWSKDSANGEGTTSTWNRSSRLHLISRIEHNGLEKRATIVQSQYVSGLRFNNNPICEEMRRSSRSYRDITHKLDHFCPRILPLQSTRALVQSWRNSVTLTQMPSLHIMSRAERSGRFAFTSVMLKCFTFEIWNRRHQEPALMRTTSRQVWFVHVFRQ